MRADSKHIVNLIDKYFEGLTTLQEEQTLRDYFQQDNIPEELKSYQPMFQYFAEARTPARILPVETRRATSLQRKMWFAIAASVLLLLGLRFALSTYKTLPETSLAYIDGKKMTDIALIQKEALRALENLSEENEEVYASQIDALDFFLENN
jgi:hypothetical protein